MTTTIRSLRAEDEAEWRRLWTGYPEFCFEQLAILARRQGG